MRVRITWDKGINFDALASELGPGFVSNGNNVRFRNGFAERIGGIFNAGTISVVPEWIGLYPSPLSPTEVFATYAGERRAYANPLSIGVESEITRYLEGAAISSITRVGTTATLTTATNHGRTTGDTVSIWGALPSQYNGTYVITVTGVTTFTYTMASDPGASASPVGLYSYNGSTLQFSNGSIYSGGAFNGVFLLNTDIDGLYYWNGDTATRLRLVPNSYVARVAKPFKNYVVALAPTISGTEYPRRVAWSNAAEPGTIPTTFTAAATNDAGGVDLAETGGDAVDCLALGDVNIIYKKDSRYAMQYIGGNDVFRFTKLPGTDGLLRKECVVDTPVGHVFLSQNLEVLQHAGGECRNLSKGRVQTHISNYFAANTNTSVCFLAVDKQNTEVWVFINTDEALVWNWADDTWGRKTLTADAVNHATGGVLGTYFSTPFERLLLAMNSEKLGIQDESTTDLGIAFSSFVERTGIDAGDPDAVKSLHRSRWNFDGESGATFSIQHGSAMTADATPTYASAVTYTLGTTDYGNGRATGGRYLAAKVTWSSGTYYSPGRLRSCDLDITGGGKR